VDPELLIVDLELLIDDPELLIVEMRVYRKEEGRVLISI